MDEKVVLVSGAGKGIGKAIVLAFAKAHAKVAFFDQVPDRISEVEEELNKLGSKYLTKQLDGKNIEGMDQFVDEIIEKLGPIDVLINNLGVGMTKRFSETTQDVFDQIYDTNLKSPFFLTQKVVSQMKPGSNIIFITSIHSEHPSLDPTYDGSKTSINNLVINLALGLGQKEIRVNGIAPGHIDVNTSDKPREQEDVPLFKEAGLPEDVAQACLFLADNVRARYITGAIIPVTGGLHIPIARDIKL